MPANGGALTVDKELLADSRLGNASVTVSVLRSGAFDIPAMLMTLDRYPYGCAEQTTSRALPLLYLSELTKSSGMPDDPQVKDRIKDAQFPASCPISHRQARSACGAPAPATCGSTPMSPTS